LWLLDRFREQARSHSGFVVNTGFAHNLTKPVGAGLLAKAAVHPTSPFQADRYRE